MIIKIYSSVHKALQMNKKNYIAGIVFLIILCIVNSGCKKDVMPYKPGPSPFSATVEGNIANIPAAGDTLKINIKAGSNGWWIVIPEDKKSWCEPLNKKIYGSGDYTLPLIFRKNTTGTSRSVSVDVNSSYQQPKVTLVFNQAG